MGYVIRRLVAHSHEVVLDGLVVGRLELVPRVPMRASHWRVVLDPDVAQDSMPAPFTEAERTFQTFAAAVAWLDATW